MIELLLSWIWIGMEAASLYCFGAAFFKRRLCLGRTLLVLLLYQGFMLIHANALLYRLPLVSEKLLGLLALSLTLAALFYAPWYSCAAGAVGVFFSAQPLKSSWWPWLPRSSKSPWRIWSGKRRFMLCS